MARDAARLEAASEPFDLVFLDPPYRSGLVVPALVRLQSGWLIPETRIIVEQAAQEPFEPPDGYVLEEGRRYGAAKFWLLRQEA